MADSTPKYTIKAGVPTLEQYLYLRKTSGLSSPPERAVSKGLQNSKHCILARLEPSSEHPEGEPIGMLRAVGDGSLFMQLVDMCVLPQYQGVGIGKALMDAMLQWVGAECPDVYLNLIGDPNAQSFYLRMGFTQSSGTAMKISAWGR